MVSPPAAKEGSEGYSCSLHTVGVFACVEAHGTESPPLIPMSLAYLP